MNEENKEIQHVGDFEGTESLNEETDPGERNQALRNAMAERHEAQTVYETLGSVDMNEVGQNFQEALSTMVKTEFGEIEEDEALFDAAISRAGEKLDSGAPNSIETYRTAMNEIRRENPKERDDFGNQHTDADLRRERGRAVEEMREGRENPAHNRRIMVGPGGKEIKN